MASTTSPSPKHQATSTSTISDPSHNENDSSSSSVVENKESYSEPEWSKSFREAHSAPYWLNDIDDKINPEIRKILTEYSHIPESEIKKHVYDTREKLWSIRSYPCTGLGVWLFPELTISPAYDTIVSRLRDRRSSSDNNKKIFLDVGAFMGYDLRRLMFDGCPAESLVGMDIISHWEVGGAFFRDSSSKSSVQISGDDANDGNDNDDDPRKKEWEKVRFIESDILQPRGELKNLDGQVDFLSISHVIHQWPRRTQIDCIQRLIDLTKPGPGTLIVGFQAGNVRPRPLESHAGVELTKVEDRPYVHDAESWKRLWEDAGREYGKTNGKEVVKFDVKARLLEWEEAGRKKGDYDYMGDEMKLLEFVVERLN